MALSHIINYTAATKGGRILPSPLLPQPACFLGASGHPWAQGWWRHKGEVVALHLLARDILRLHPFPIPQSTCPLLRSIPAFCHALLPERPPPWHRSCPSHHDCGPSADANHAQDRGEMAPGPEVGCFSFCFSEKRPFCSFFLSVAQGQEHFASKADSSNISFSFSHELLPGDGWGWSRQHRCHLWVPMQSSTAGSAEHQGHLSQVMVPLSREDSPHRDPKKKQDRHAGGPFAPTTARQHQAKRQGGLRLNPPRPRHGDAEAPPEFVTDMP